MLVKPDFSEVQEEITPGTYKVRIRKGEVKSWDGGGTYVNWELETFGESESKNNGRRVYYRTAASGKGAFVLQKFYKAVTGKPLTGEFDTETLVGKEVTVDIAEGVNRKTGEPTGYMEVTSVKPITHASMN